MARSVEIRRLHSVDERIIADLAGAKAPHAVAPPRREAVEQAESHRRALEGEAAQVGIKLPQPGFENSETT